MRSWFRGEGSLVGDVILAAMALALVLSAVALTLGTVWHPVYLPDLIVVAVASAVAWPLSRVMPRTALVIAAVMVSWPWWWFDDPELRILPLVVTAFRCALSGVPALLVVGVSAVPVAVTLMPGLWSAVSNVLGGYGLWIVVPDPSRRFLTVLVFASIVGLGYLMRALRDQAAELRDRNDALAALRAADEQRVADQVRHAVARDIHDVVAHHVSAMVIQAQAAERVRQFDPERSDAAVRAVVVEGGEALAAMRGLVRVLRGIESVPEDRMPLAAAVERMAERLRAAGTSVDVSLDTGGAPEYVETAVLQIVTEALTNIMLHADASNVRVGLQPVGGALQLSVRDDGRTAAASARPAGTGHGVPGMRHRADALGGVLTAGPAAGGGWSVVAHLPLDPASAPAPT